jgi:hypothetical protein
MAKTDINNVFRIIPIHPHEAIVALGLKFKIMSMASSIDE